jgi:hypothetical protein
MKWLKRFGVLLLIIIVVLAVLFYRYNEPKPVGQKGSEADALANQMLNAIDKTGWDSTTYVQWTFKGIHSFLWDKDRNFVKVAWGETEVFLDTKKVDGKVFIKGVEEIGSLANKLIQDAWSYFCNDSFWLNAPAKAFDPGTERSIVTQEDGSKGLMVSYTSGGVTPGDSYLWILDENYLPKSWKMWVKIIPVGGIEFSWEQWKNLSTGAKVATFHKSKILNLDISDLKGALTLDELGINNDPFKILE